jgi:pimeloyl-ACP methyl ester carboxylesterase
MHLAISKHGTKKHGALVLLHAFPLNRRMWKKQCEGLMGRFQVFAPDLPGFGQSPLLKSEPTLSAYAKTVVNMMDQYELDQAILGGCSMGGYIALQLVKEYPERFRGLILCDTKATADTEEARQNRYTAIENARTKGLKPLAETMVPMLLGKETKATKPELVKGISEAIVSNPVNAIVHAQTAMANRNDFTPLLETITCPTLLVFGEDDGITPPDIGRELQRLISGSELLVVERAGHLSPLEQPEAVNEKILSVFGMK